MSRLRFRLNSAWLAGFILVAGCAQSTRPRPILVVYTSPRCAQCELEKPAVQRIHNSGLARVKLIDFSKYRGTFGSFQKKYGVKVLPTYDIYVEGKRIWRGSYIAEASKVLRSR